MADNYLERHMRDYEERKARWIARKNQKRLLTKTKKQPLKANIQRPDDEAL